MFGNKVTTTEMASNERAKSEESLSQENPFHNQLEWTLSDRIKVFLGFIILCPIRVLLLIISGCLAHVIGRIILLFAPDPSDVDGPRTYSDNLRKVQKMYGTFFGNLGFLLAGIWVTQTGEQVSRDEAPLLLVAPHTAFYDSLMVLYCKSCALERIEDKNNLLLWPVFKVLQNFFVDRNSQESRQQAKETILERVTSSEPWPQVMIFPEGYIGNGKSLLRFNKGCLTAGTSVQPVAMRYDIRPSFNYVTWSNTKQNPIGILLRTLAHPYTRLYVDFLPVYHPSIEEKDDIELYAKNIQKVFAQHLSLPCTNITKKTRREDSSQDLADKKTS